MSMGVVVMTALVPTIGHQYLVNFAQNFMAATSDDGSDLFVIVCGRPQEPIRAIDRMYALKEMCFADSWWNSTYFRYIEEDLPQNPEDDPNFWQIWKDVVLQETGNYCPDYLFASEMYGVEYAKQFDAEFIPCDIDREVFPVKGTSVRYNITANWDKIVPSMKKQLRKTFTIFGAESTGKTTLARGLAAHYKGKFVHEWARPYLERFGPETTDENMKIIERAQYAAQMGVRAIPDTPMVFQDTDLLSTIGYYRIYCEKEPESIRHLFEKTKSDLYFVMNSLIPFEADPLRYGGDKRESTDQFWIDLLEEFGCKYHAVKSVRWLDRWVETNGVIDAMYRDDPIRTFVRD
jgi:HTH-type transcriptional regulator, transcriptional repressor of NAD biosynthesis genes